jgi:chromosome partitioning protein
MPAKIVTVAQQKGGAGKTTLACHLAVAWAQAGRKVATVDIDPQGSLSRWHEQRNKLSEGGGAGGEEQPVIAHSRITGWRTQGEVEKLARTHDLVVIDSPPHAETEARIAVRAAHIVVVPVQPSPMDLWAVQPTLEMARQEKAPILLVLNRVPPRAKIADTLIEKIGELISPPLVELSAVRIGNRTAYAGALFEGRSVTEGGKSAAAEEIAALAAEILQRAESARK